MSKLIETEFDAITYKIIGAAMKVHDSLGPGFKEVHYQKAMETSLGSIGLDFEAQKQIGVYFNKTLAGLLFMDIYVENQIVVELKALYHLLTKNEIAQVITYLKASKSKIGLLINFGRKYLEYKRIFPPSAITEFDEKDWRYVYKFKNTNFKFDKDGKNQRVTYQFD